MNKSIGFYSMLYAAFVVMALVIVYAITYAVATYAPDLYSSLFEGGGGVGMSVVILILPPMLVAQSFYKHEQRRTQGGESWIMTVIFTVLFLALVVGAAYLMNSFFPASQAEMAELEALLTEDSGFLAVFIAVIAGFVFFTNKLMLWAGIRGAIKQEEKLAAKARKKAARNG